MLNSKYVGEYLRPTVFCFLVRKSKKMTNGTVVSTVGCKKWGIGTAPRISTQFGVGSQGRERAPNCVENVEQYQFPFFYNPTT